MNIYESLNLAGNSVSNMVISTTGYNAAGGIKYDSSGKLMLYYSGGWHEIGGSSTETNYVDGTFNIGNADSSTFTGGTKVTGNNTFDVVATASGSSNTASALKYQMTSGKLRIGTANSDPVKYIELDVSGSVANEMCFYSDFTTTETGTNYVTIENALKSTNIVVSVYEKTFYKATDASGSVDRIAWTVCACEVDIRDPQDGCDILLTLHGVSANKDFKVVVVGAPSAITGSGSQAQESSSAKSVTTDSSKISGTSPIARE